MTNESNPPIPLHGGDGDGDGQDTYLLPLEEAPEGFIMPPSDSQFANATWMMGGPELKKIAEEVLAYEEFSEIRDIPYVIVWRRNGAPKRKVPGGDDEPIFATVERISPRTLWFAQYLEEADYPQYYIDLRWPNFQAERDDGMWVNYQIVGRDIHHALMGMEVINDRLTTRPPDFRGWAATVQRFGIYTPGLGLIRKQMRLWDDDDD